MSMLQAAFATLERGVSMAAPAHAAQAVRAKQEALSRQTLYAARALAMQEALLRLAALAYEVDAYGLPFNVDRATRRLLVPAPMGRAGHRLYGLRRSEGEALRRWLHVLQRSAKAGKAPAPLFWYAPDSRNWYLGEEYQTLEQAQRYLEARPVTASALHRLEQTN